MADTDSGWADERLMQALDLIEAVIRDNAERGADLRQLLTAARDRVREADEELEREHKLDAAETTFETEEALRG